MWKIFGQRAERIIGSPDADLPRGELREKTGCVAAVRDVSLQVWPGEVFVVLNSGGFLEIACHRGSASHIVGAGKGSDVGVLFETTQIGAITP